ncbi:fungal-specific transcription factor domain-containing protein [Mycena capillaripes]|nr:fungal-specific transcription factor domain-containing protein [Mycena capillaripes]
MHQINEDPAGARTIQNGKRRRVQNSCDVCKRRKIRCDSAEMPGNRCTNCLTSHIECTHARLSLKGVEIPGAPSRQSLKTGQEHVATILSTSTVYVPPNDFNAVHRILLVVAQYARSLEEKLAALQPQTPVPILKSRSQTPSSIEDRRFSEDGVLVVQSHGRVPIREAFGAVTRDERGSWGHYDDTLEKLGVSPPAEAARRGDRFYGKSSSIQFIKSAMKHVHENTSYVAGVQRAEFWTAQPWESLAVEEPHQIFPENDLLKSLIKIYFEQINPILGILHFPSFHQSILDGLHFRDREFGGLVLIVCSLASRHSDDPRVFLDGSSSEHSCGWKWFKQVRPLRASFSPEPSLYELQTIFLSAIYLCGTSTPEEGWLLVGLGIRFAQGAGAHHRNGYSKMDALTAELYKRVFWVLVVSDTIMSSFKGRPSITKPADFDLDLPVGLDDEYWGIPDAVQPSGKPSSWAFTPVFMQLMEIFGRIQGAVYPVNGKIYSDEVIVELDSALNKWIDTIPEHLRWDPNQRNQIFLDQSAVLYSTYYHAQILIHRPFIPAPGKESRSNVGDTSLLSFDTETHILKISFPSLAICANAARSCGHVLDVQSRRSRGLLHYPSLMVTRHPSTTLQWLTGMQTALFDSAVVLLVNVWAIGGGRKSQTEEDFTRATADAENCVRVLHLYERRWRLAGRKCDVISAMLNIGKYTSGKGSSKRSRNTKTEVDPTPDALEVTLVPPDSDPTASADEQIQELERSMEETGNLFSLPLHTEELGRLPVYDSFDYEFIFKSHGANYHDQPHAQLHLGSQYDAATYAAGDLLHGVDPARASISPTQHASGEDIQLPQVSFDIPSGYGCVRISYRGALSNIST